MGSEDRLNKTYRPHNHETCLTSGTNRQEHIRHESSGAIGDRSDTLTPHRHPPHRGRAQGSPS